MVEHFYAKEKAIANNSHYLDFSLMRMSLSVHPVGLVSTAPFWKQL